MHAPKVSLIITTYNRSNFLCRAIESALSQTYKNIEIIVVDDNSTDNTSLSINKYKDTIVYIRNKKNIGVSASRNIGILKSSGYYISFLDDDDEIHPEKIEKQLNIFINDEKVDAVYCGSIKKYKKYVLEKKPRLNGIIYPKVLEACPNTIHSLLLKKKCIEDAGFFDEQMRYYEDFDFWIRLSMNCIFAYVRESLVVYNIHGNQMSVNSKKAIEGIDYILEKHKKIFNANKKYLYIHLRRQASKSAVNDNYKDFYKYILRAIMTRPFSFGPYVHLFLSFISRRIHKYLIRSYGIKKIDGVITY